MTLGNIDDHLKWNQSRPMSKWVRCWIGPSRFCCCCCCFNFSFFILFYFILFYIFIKSSKRISNNNLQSLKVVRPKRAKILIQKVETFVWWGTSSYPSPYKRLYNSATLESSIFVRFQQIASIVDVHKSGLWVLSLYIPFSTTEMQSFLNTLYQYIIFF